MGWGTRLFMPTVLLSSLIFAGLNAPPPPPLFHSAFHVCSSHSSLLADFAKKYPKNSDLQRNPSLHFLALGIDWLSRRVPVRRVSPRPRGDGGSSPRAFGGNGRKNVGPLGSTRPALAPPCRPLRCFAFSVGVVLRPHAAVLQPFLDCSFEDLDGALPSARLIRFLLLGFAFWCWSWGWGW